MNSNTKKVSLILLLVALGIGFAALTATLTINGTVTVNGNANDFQVVFDPTYSGSNAVAKISNQETTIALGSDGENQLTITDKAITFNPTLSLIAVGDTYTINYKIKNNSTMYDANVTISCKTADGSSDISPFVQSGTSTWTNLQAKDEAVGSIVFTYSGTEVTEDKAVSIVCTQTASAVSRTSIAS